MPKNIFKISRINAREILDSRGNPTVEAEVVLDCGISAKASVPSGASTGEHEAVELRDEDKKRYAGKGVLKVCENIRTKINKGLKGMDILQQQEIDKRMIELDGTDNKGNLGANATLAVSLACCRAGALVSNLELHEYISK
ncbi:MAG: phosphopyruvate hydratase, partial [Patescibacteria group bacterium]